jgi:outer membrane protein insertion porin family
MLKRCGILLFCLAGLTLCLPGQETIQRISVQGNRRVPRETILFYFGLYPGSSYNIEAISRGVEALWNSGFFADIRIAEQKGETGPAVILTVEEYPIVKKIEFDTEKKIRQKEIEDRVRAKNIDMLPYSVYNPQKIDRIKEQIEALLEDKGFNQGKVVDEVVDEGNSLVRVVFHIQEGPRYKIGKIEFEGNPKLERSVLLSAFRFNREHSLLSWIQRRDNFRKAKLDEDLENLKNKYRELGYVEAEIGKPRVGEFSKRTFFGGVERLKKIIIPVDAGERYTTGEIHVKGNEAVPSSQLMGLILLREGQVFDGEKKNLSIEKIRQFYQNNGYLYVQVFTYEFLDSEERRVDLDFEISEGVTVYLRRLRISGNTFTRDVVLRREISLSEQDKLQVDLLTRGVRKLVRLGMMGIEKPPEMRPDPKDPSRMDVDLRIVEKYRNEWQFTGGYTGYHGPYVGAYLSSIDFFGVGEKLDLVLEYGRRSKNYSAGFSRPYLWGRPLSFNFRLFDRYVLYPDLFDRTGKGIQLGFDTLIDDYWWSGISYDFERVDAVTYGTEENEKVTGQDIGRFSVFLFRDSVDNPLFPTEGIRGLFSFELASSELGGDIQYIKPSIEGSVFFHTFGKHFFGLHLEYRFIQGIRHSVTPPWERFYLGGERSIRGYQVYSIGPRSPEGRNEGGEKSLVFNLEYSVPLMGPLYAIYFFDAGNAYRRSAKIDLTRLYWSSGLELRFRVPSIFIPVRLIFAYNNRLIEAEDSHFAFRIAFGRSF